MNKIDLESLNLYAGIAIFLLIICILVIFYIDDKDTKRRTNE